MITAVIDTNVLASGFVRPEPAPGQLLLAWRERLYTLVVSEHILAELARTFEAPYFQTRFSEAQRINNVALIRDEAIFTSITVNIAGVATHPEDDLVLATAVSANADYLVTGDTQLQKLRTYQGVSIVSPRQFLETLG
ncbi:MAG: putative toxin-antitoxin system toxin component, PIN family [Chloroflexi bacterium]|nr:putative toxin-antitoxin system toxin component, PIN family [Chloroflexota bacterium]